ncbi:MAG: aspartate 1-decarboxylase [Lentisphaerae bacterium]|jgi:aspartate 1-decarboxylase|nr:aspartate 1-decarboxylase [Lentisphaeria bacterium]NLE54461.1 aspartate 1-decarboxylase [Lentisphaerota bacterium]HQL08452.1 aspartate 1-decarboxylase [Lentisphaeria bacterium]
MHIQILKSKLHRAMLTACELNYQGSLSIDRDLLDLAGIFPYEKILVVNQNNGLRLETYAIEAPRGSREFCLNGAAARLGLPGDMVTIMAFASIEPAEAADWKPTVVVLSEQNKQATVL